MLGKICRVLSFFPTASKLPKLNFRIENYNHLPEGLFTIEGVVDNKYFDFTVRNC